MNIIQGIYKIKNNITREVYIGQSVHIYRRWSSHVYSSLGKSIDSNNKIHTAMRLYGVENFSIEVLEEIANKNDLNKKEIFWIKHFDSYHNGYNGTIGGTSVQGEDNPRAILKKEDVYVIRQMYNSKIPFRTAYSYYNNLISKRGFQKIWQHKTWVDVCPEVYTFENIEWHKTLSKGFCQSSIGGNEERKISEDKIKKIKKLFEQELSYNKISNIVGCAPSTVRRYALDLNSEKVNRGISIKNIETNIIFNSYTEAGKWANCARHAIAKCINGKRKIAGFLPDSNVGATWTDKLN